MSESKIDLHLLNRFFAGAEFQCARSFSLALGPTFNMLVSDTQSAYYSKVSNVVAPFILSENNNSPDKTNVKMWVGANLSIRLF